jgi:hypothetical protein
LAYPGQPKRAIIREVPDKPRHAGRDTGIFPEVTCYWREPLALAIEDGQDFEIPAQPRPPQFATAESE